MNSNTKIFVICLESEKDREQTISNHLTDLGLNFEILPAVDGRKIKDLAEVGYSESVAVEILGRPMGKGEVGCYLSHLTIWKKMVEENISKTIVLESDALLTDESLKTLRALENYQPTPELVMLYYRECYPSIWGQLSITEKTKLVRFSNKSSCTTAYMLSLAGAEKLMKHSLPIHLPVDDYMTGKYIDKNLSTFAAFPRCFHTTDVAHDTSTIRLELEDRFQIKSGNKNTLKKLEIALRRRVKQLKRPSWL